MVDTVSPRPMRRRPTGQVVSHHLDGQPGAVGGEASRGQVVEPHAVLQVADGVLNLSVAAVVSFQFQGVTLPVGDEGVIAVIGEERQLGAGRGFHPAYDEADRYSVGLAAGRECRSVSATSAAPSIQYGNGRPSPSSGMASMMLRRPRVLADR